MKDSSCAELTRKRPLIWAHRGASKVAPENTLAAFRQALEFGADGVELDVHLTADGQVAVIHDDTVDRTTDGAGRVADLTLAAIKSFDAGSKHSAEFSGQKVPTLEEVLELVIGWPGSKRVLIELKGPPTGLGWAASVGFRAACMLKLCHAEPIQPELSVAVARILERYEAQVKGGHIVAQSFCRPYLEQLRELVPSLKLLYLSISCCSGPLEKEDLANMDLGFAGVAVRHASLSHTRIVRLRSYHHMVFAWTVNSDKDVSKLLQLGIDGVITDRPDMALKVINDPSAGLQTVSTMMARIFKYWPCQHRMGTKKTK